MFGIDYRVHAIFLFLGDKPKEQQPVLQFSVSNVEVRQVYAASIMAFSGAIGTVQAIMFTQGIISFKYFIYLYIYLKKVLLDPLRSE